MIKKVSSNTSENNLKQRHVVCMSQTSGVTDDQLFGHTECNEPIPGGPWPLPEFSLVRTLDYKCRFLVYQTH